MLNIEYNFGDKFKIGLVEVNYCMLQYSSSSKCSYPEVSVIHREN